MANFFKTKPRTAGVLAGAVIGAVLGLLVIGNFGVARGGGGFGVLGWFFGGCLGAYIGYRVGEWRLRRASGAPN